jgi:hypothetical protein
MNTDDETGCVAVGVGVISGLGGSNSNEADGVSDDCAGPVGNEEQPATDSVAARTSDRAPTTEREFTVTSS